MNDIGEPVAETSPSLPFLHADILYHLFRFFTYKELDTSVVHVCQLWNHVAKKRMRQLLMLPYTYNGISAVDADPDCCYRPFHWQEKWLSRWQEILKKENSLSQELPLPPLVLHEEVIDDVVAIVIFCLRIQNELRVYSAFHPKVPPSVPPLNLQVEVRLAFTSKGCTRWTVEKQIVATVKHKTDRIFIVYDVPFASFVPLSAPTATDICIKSTTPDQKWSYLGLPSRVTQNGQFITIDCNSLCGAEDSGREWKKIVDDWLDWPARLHLPPLLVKCESQEDVPVCVFGERNGNGLYFRAKFHPSMAVTVKSLEMTFEIDVHVTLRDNVTILKLHSEDTVVLDHGWPSKLVGEFIEFPWSTVSSSAPPRISLSILIANYGSPSNTNNTTNS